MAHLPGKGLADELPPLGLHPIHDGDAWGTPILRSFAE